MEDALTIVATEVFDDSPASILDYLVRRTSDTIGKEVDRAAAIVVGEVEETGGHSVDVQAGDAPALREWFSGEAGPAPKIMVYQTRIRVEEWLKGPGEPGAIYIVYVPSTKSHDSELLPQFDVHDHGLLYLRTIPTGLPYAFLVPAQSYQLSLGETGMRRFQATDYDPQGHSYAGDVKALVSQTTAAIRWYLELPQGVAGGRHKALTEALQNANPDIVHDAVRELAEASAVGGSQRFEHMLITAKGKLRVELMLGLWLLGNRKAALQILEQEFREGKDLWLARWGVQSSLTESGEPTGSLFGPDSLGRRSAEIEGETGGGDQTEWGDRVKKRHNL